MSSLFPDVKKIPVIVSATGIIIFIYVLLRAAWMPITYDEAFSFLNFVLVDWQLFHPENYMAGNNHPLNTILMTGMYECFGPSEFSLRFPNVMAFLLYAFFSYKFSRCVSFPHLRYGLFLLLICSPFLLDFFSLARGYGLMLAFLMGALWQVFKKEAGLRTIGLFGLFSLLAIYSNLAALHFVLAGMGVLMLRIVLDFKTKPVRQSVVRLSVCLTTCLLVLLIVLPWAFALNDIKTLFYGGKEGFWKDTVPSLLKVMMYRKPYAHFISDVGTYLVIFCVGIGLLFFYKKLTEERLASLKSKFSVAFLLLTGAGIIGTLQHFVMGTNFLIERTALPFIPLFFIFLLFFIDELNSKWIQFSMVAVMIAVPVLHFFVSINFSYTEQWKEDRNTREFFGSVYEKTRQKSDTSVFTQLSGGDFIFQTCFNYYKFIDGADQVELFSHQIPAPFLHYYISHEGGNHPQPGPEWMRVKEDKETGNSLWERKPVERILLLDTFIDYGSIAPEQVPVHRKTKDCFSPPLCGYTNGVEAEFCSWLEYKLPDSLKGSDILLTTQGQLKWIGQRCAGGFVVDLADSTGAIDWTIFPFLHYHPEERGWQTFQLSRTIDHKKLAGNQFNIYAWNRKGAELFLDDLRVKLYVLKNPQ